MSWKGTWLNVLLFLLYLQTVFDNCWTLLSLQSLSSFIWNSVLFFFPLSRNADRLCVHTVLIERWYGFALTDYFYLAFWQCKHVFLRTHVSSKYGHWLVLLGMQGVSAAGRIGNLLWRAFWEEHSMGDGVPVWSNQWSSVCREHLEPPRLPALGSLPIY